MSELTLLKRIAANLTTTVLAAVVSSFATVGIIINFQPQDYGNFAMALLIVNSAGLLNIFRPRIISGVAAGAMTIDGAAAIAGAALAISSCLLFLLVLVLVQGMGWGGAFPIAIAAFFSSLSTIMADELDGLGRSVFSVSSRNMMWTLFYPLVLFLSVYAHCGLNWFLWLLAISNGVLFLFLFLNTTHFRKIPVRSLVRWNRVVAEIRSNLKMGAANISSLILGSADRWVLWWVAPSSSVLGHYSAISDISARLHVLFRVSSTVLTSEIAAGRETADRVWGRVCNIIILGFSIVVPVQFVLPEILPWIGVESREYLFVASMFCCALPSVACGYYSMAVLHARGDVRTSFMVYGPASILFLAMSLMYLLVADVRWLGFAYALSRISDLVLLAKTGVRYKYLTLFFLMSALGWGSGYLFYG